MTGILLCLAAVLLSTAVLAVILLRSGAVAVEADDARPDPVDAVHDEYQRSAWFTPGGCPVVAGPEPGDVAVDDPKVAQLIWECRHALDRLARGDDIYAGARREPSPEVKR